MHKQRIFILVAAGLGLIGLILPWQTFSVGWLGSGSANALNSGWFGYCTLAGIIGGAAVIFKDSDKNVVLPADTKKLVMAGGGAAALFSLLGIIIIGSNSAAYFGASVSLGVGPFVTLISGVGILGIPFAIKGDGSFQMPTKDSIKDELK